MSQLYQLGIENDNGLTFCIIYFSDISAQVLVVFSKQVGDTKKKKSENLKAHVFKMENF